MKKIQVALFCCLMQTTFLIAQPSITELKQALTTATTDTTCYRLLKTLGKLYERKDRDSALFFYKTLVNVAEKNGAQETVLP